MADAAVTDQPIEAEPPAPPQPRRIAYRHRLPTRIWHWINALTVIVMLMSGLMILNAHPAALLGAVRRQFRSCLAVSSAATVPRLGDDPFHLQPRRRPALAPRLRLGAGRSG